MFLWFFCCCNYYTIVYYTIYGVKLGKKIEYSILYRVTKKLKFEYIVTKI